MLLKKMSYSTESDHHDADKMVVPFSYSSYKPKKKRIIAKLGTEYIILPVSELVVIYTVNKVVFCLSKTGKKFIIEGTNLNLLMEELPEHLFFRANRQVIISIQYIHSCKPIGGGKIMVSMQLESFQPVQISQENAAEFKKWVGQ